MLWAFSGIILGILLGLVFNISIPQEITKYTAVMIIGITDALFNAMKREVRKEKYDIKAFLIELLLTMVFAVAITYFGEHLGLNLYLAVTVVFTFRIFQNVEQICSKSIEQFFRKTKSLSRRKK